jgi:hypothetical protein
MAGRGGQNFANALERFKICCHGDIRALRLSRRVQLSCGDCPVKQCGNLVICLRLVDI